MGEQYSNSRRTEAMSRFGKSGWAKDKVSKRADAESVWSGKYGAERGIADFPCDSGGGGNH